MFGTFQEWDHPNTGTGPYPSAAEMQRINRRYGFQGTHLSNPAVPHKQGPAPKPTPPPNEHVSLKQRLDRLEVANTMLREQALDLKSECSRLQAEVADGKRARKKLKRELEKCHKQPNESASLRRGIRRALLHCHPDKSRDGQTDAAKMTRVLLSLLEQ